MKSPICEMLGIDFPLLAFSHCRDVVAAVSRAGGFGVLGATGHTLKAWKRSLPGSTRMSTASPMASTC